MHHGVRIRDDAIIAAAVLSDRYITSRFLPDKAIDLIDEAASRLKMEIESQPTELDRAERKILQLTIEKQALSKETDPASRERLADAEQGARQAERAPRQHEAAVAEREDHHRGDQEAEGHPGGALHGGSPLRAGRQPEQGRRDQARPDSRDARGSSTRRARSWRTSTARRAFCGRRSPRRTSPASFPTGRASPCPRCSPPTRRSS